MRPHPHSPRENASRELLVSVGAASRLRAACEWLSALPNDAEVLILAPHGHAADELVRAAVTAKGARFGIQRFTLARLAARLAAPELARRRLVPASMLSLVAVVTRSVHGLVERGRCGRFAPVAQRPGFPHAVARLYEEVRVAGVMNGDTDLRRLAELDADLSTLLTAVHAQLAEASLASGADTFETAIAVIERAPPAAFNTPVLLLDLALDVEIERRFLAALVDRAPSVLATAASGDRVAVTALAALLHTEPQELPLIDASPSLTRLQQHVFEETVPEPRALDETLSLTSWPGEARECIEIARRVHAEAARGIRFDRIAVLLRSPANYRAHIEEAFRRASIPAWFALGTTRPDPGGRALLALLACAAEGLSARRFAEYLSLAQVPAPSEVLREPWVPADHELMPARGETLIESPPGEHPADALNSTSLEGALRAPWRWERLIADAAVIGGEDRWRRRLDGLAEELRIQRRELDENDARLALLDRRVADVEHLKTFALPLIARLATLPRQGTWSEWLVQLRDVCSIAIREPTAVLSALSELEPMSSVGPIDLTTVQHVLTPRLRELAVAPEGRPYGAVFVGPAEMGRGLDFDIVFVPGLAERLFPQRVLDDALLPDAARATLTADTLATRHSRVVRERMALRLAAGAASRCLWLSWPRVDIEKARARVPSFYALEALRAAEGTLPGFDDLRARAETAGRAQLGWPAPERAEDAIDNAEYDLGALAALKGADPQATAGAAAYLLTTNVYLARALRARGRRWLRRWTPADGLVDADDVTLQALAQHRLRVRSFSPTMLESFASCPYRFLLRAIHRLQPSEWVEGLEVVDPLTRGALVHEIQFAVLTELRDRGHLPLDPRQLATVFALLDETLTRVGALYAERLAPAIPRVWEDELNAVRYELREWLRRLAEDADGWQPHRFELSFGLTHRRGDATDAASVSEPVSVLDGVLLRGSIDLVERRDAGMLRVTDHKTGKARVPEDAVIWGGQALQPVLYALVAETLLQTPVESGRLYYCTADGDFIERRVPLNDRSRCSAKTAVEIIDRSIEQGFLPAAPAAGACRRCDYRLVCGPHEELRTARKPTDRLQDLSILRGLP